MSAIQVERAEEGESPAPCEVCGYNTSIDSTGIRVISNTKAHPNQLLCLLCLPCFARGLVWSARQSLGRAEPTSARFDDMLAGLEALADTMHEVNEADKQSLGRSEGDAS